MRKLIVVISFIAAIGWFAKSAHAASDNTCTVNSVYFVNDTWGHVFFFTCTSGNVYYAYLSGGGTGCPTFPSDDIKLWQSLASSAYLTGKNTQLTYKMSTCGGSSVRTLTSFGLK